MRHQKEKTEQQHLLPPDVTKKHPNLSTALVLRTYHLLDLLEWIEEHPAHLTPEFKRKSQVKDEVMQELAWLTDQCANCAGSEILRTLYKMHHYASMYIIENTQDRIDDQVEIWSFGNVIEFFQRLYKRGII